MFSRSGAMNSGSERLKFPSQKDSGASLTDVKTQATTYLSAAFPIRLVAATEQDRTPANARILMTCGNKPNVESEFVQIYDTQRHQWE